MKALAVIAVLLLAGCSEDVDPPNTMFQVAGKHVVVDGQIKPGAKVTVEEAKLAIQVAVDSVE
jgi:uncharacterized lipoprotein YmbA